MSLYVIAEIVSGDEQLIYTYSGVFHYIPCLGFRIYDNKMMDFEDIDIDQVQDMLKSGVEIRGLTMSRDSGSHAGVSFDTTYPVNRLKNKRLESSDIVLWTIIGKSDKGVLSVNPLGELRKDSYTYFKGVCCRKQFGNLLILDDNEPKYTVDIDDMDLGDFPIEKDVELFLNKLSIAGNNVGYTIDYKKNFILCDRHIEYLKMPSIYEKIDDYTFYYCSKLKNIIIGSNVREIGKCAFAACVRLESITIPGNVKKIGDNCFEHCSKLSCVVFEDGVAEIGKNIFKECENLRYVRLPRTLKHEISINELLEDIAPYDYAVVVEIPRECRDKIQYNNTSARLITKWID